MADNRAGRPAQYTTAADTPSRYTTGSTEPTRDELSEQAKRAGVAGRSQMTKEEPGRAVQGSDHGRPAG